MNPVRLQQHLDHWRNKGEVIVFTNGCFDLVHLGHVDYLEKASMLGHQLIVGLNSDDSVRRLKGETRPIMDETARARVLAALQCVAAVVIFDEDTPRELIAKVKPNILCKGSDYQVSEVAGAQEVIDAGGSVELIDLVPGYSTSAIVAKIKAE